MDKINIHNIRRTIQIIVAVLFILLPILNTAGLKFIWGNFLNIHIGSLIFSDPLAVLQVFVKSWYFPPGLLISTGMVLGIAFFSGTVFCSWICPFGLLSELVNRFSGRNWSAKFNIFKINGFKVKIAIFFISFLIFYFFFKAPILNKISMPFQYSNIFQYLFNQKYLIAGIWFIGVVLLIEFIFRTRLWCRFICPQSILITIAKMFNPVGLKVIFEENKCIATKAPYACQKSCSLELNPRHLKGLNNAQCTNCGDCVDICKKKTGALKFRFRSK